MVGYKEELTEKEEEKTIKDFIPFIKYTAYRLAYRLPPSLTVDDLISVGLMGLLEALKNYDHGRAKLKTYAEIRIRGAMLDELRAFDWVPRSQKKKINKLKETYTSLEKKLGRAPEEDEIAEALNISLDEYYKILQTLHGPIVFSFEDFNGKSSNDNNFDLLECIPDVSVKTPLNILEEIDRREILTRIIDKLPENEKLVLTLYYWEELTMKEIGKVLDLTEGRICQLHSQAIIRIKAKIDLHFESKELIGA